tara:strand:- start:875 stop:1075 length:201 start_codon:yes stop_codon:yes gene_type:complete
MTARNKQPEHVLIEDITVKVKTLKAVLIIQEDREVWIPLSQVHGDVSVGDKEIHVTPWIADKKFGC